MHTRFISFAVSVALSLLFGPSLAALEPALALPISVNRVSDRVMVLTCLELNVTAVATQRGIVVIDTHYSPGIMAAIMGEIERGFGRRDFTCVINTHGHGDHCSGNQMFPDAQRIAHENCPEFMEHDLVSSPGSLRRHQRLLDRARARAASAGRETEEFQRLQGEIRAREQILADLKSSYVLTPPSRTFADTLTLDMGDLTIELMFAGEAHTNNDILVYIPEEKLLLTGDLFCSQSSFCFQVNPLADVPQILARVDTVLGREAGLAAVIPGHGELLTVSDLTRLRDLLAEEYGRYAGKRSAAAWLGRMIADLGIDAACERFSRQAAAGDQDPYVSEEEFYTLGLRLRWKGKIEEAIRAYELSLSILPASSLLLDSSAAAYLEIGDVQAAKAALERSLSATPEDRRAAEMLTELQDRLQEQRRP